MVLPTRNMSLGANAGANLYASRMQAAAERSSNAASAVGASDGSDSGGGSGAATKSARTLHRAGGDDVFTAGNDSSTTSGTVASATAQSPTAPQRSIYHSTPTQPMRKTFGTSHAAGDLAAGTAASHSGHGHGRSPVRSYK